jgi:endoglucanase
MTDTSPTLGAEQIALLERLCNASGVSGDEGEVRAIVLEQVRPLADEVKIDALGSVLVTRHARGVENPLRVMLDAHMDEVGLIIVGDDEGGLFRFVKVGGIDDRFLPGKTVLVGKEHVPGIIGTKPIHLTEPGETSSKIPLDALRIDIGPGGGKGNVGDRATFATRFQAVGPSFIAKAIDNRIGCTSLIEILRAAAAQQDGGALDGIELLLSFSVQEEIGLRGARAAGYALAPDVVIALDSTPANDLPAHDDSENYGYNTRLGGGPAIYLADGGTIADPRLARYLMQTAEQHSIPFQVRQPGAGATDAGAIHKVRGGVPAISISVPARYLHTAASLCRRADWENSFRLVWATLAGMQRELFAGERN